MSRNALVDIITKNKAEHTLGIYSICSAHPLVIEASMRQALEDNSVLLIEATSNQVDQFGGYTGMTPADFRDFILGIAEKVGVPKERLILGGDHLGPNRWQKEDPVTAMNKAEDLVRAYVKAGYTKIHLDCSMSCAGDPRVLTDEIVAERAARLLRAAKEEETALAGPVPLSFVIGTEVPVPGGAHEELGVITPTSREAAEKTIRTHKEAFALVGLEDAWKQIVAMVVQPAVEFDHLKIVDYKPEGTLELQHAIDDEPLLAFECHSSDYQTTANLTRLVHDGWAILKVGPGLTFALREGLYALSAMEECLIADPAKRAKLPEVIESVMLAHPENWESYYEGSEEEQRLARVFSYSDRMRYYLPQPQIVQAIDTLIANLEDTGIPEPVISQHMPLQFARVREGVLAPNARELLIDHIRDAIRPYATACGV